MASETRRKATTVAKIRKVIAAVESYNLVESPAWDDLDVLSTRTMIDGVEVDPEGVSLERGERFQGVMNVYVMLEYAGGTSEGFTTPDSFLGTFAGHFDAKGEPVIDTVAVNTSHFYDGEP